MVVFNGLGSWNPVNAYQRAHPISRAYLFHRFKQQGGSYAKEVAESALWAHATRSRADQPPGNKVVQALGAAAGGTLGFIHGNLPGAVIGAGLGYDASNMATRNMTSLKRARDESEVYDEDPPKKKQKGFLQKVWDNGGKHLAIAAGSVAGAYALGKGAQYVDRKTGGHAAKAIGRTFEAGRTAIGRMKSHGPSFAATAAGMAAHAMDGGEEADAPPDATPGQARIIRNDWRSQGIARPKHLPNHLDNADLSSALVDAYNHPQPRTLSPAAQEWIARNPQAAAFLRGPVGGSNDEDVGNVGPSGVVHRRPSLRPSMTRQILPEAPATTRSGDSHVSPDNLTALQPVQTFTGKPSNDPRTSSGMRTAIDDEARIGAFSHLRTARTFLAAEEASLPARHSSTFSRTPLKTQKLKTINEIPSDKELDLFRGYNFKHAGLDLNKFNRRKAPVRVDQADGQREPPSSSLTIGRMKRDLKNRRMHVLRDPEI